MATITASSVSSSDSVEKFRQEFNALRSDVSNINSGAISITNESNNRILTSVSTNTLNAEESLTFDGSTFSVGGGAQTTLSGNLVIPNAGNIGSADDTDAIAIASNGAVTFSSDVTLTGDSANAVWDKSANALEFADNAKAIFGTGDDLQIYHDGSDSLINDNGTGSLKLQTGGSAKLEVTSSGISVTGDLQASGALSKGSGSFKIDHPLPAKSDTHHLVHSFVEGPQADLIYRGRADLVDGSSTVNIDTAAGMTEGTFVSLCADVQCFTSNESGWTSVKGFVSGNTLTITAQDNTCTDTISWMVVGERKDAHMVAADWTDSNGKVIVETLKPVVE